MDTLETKKHWPLHRLLLAWGVHSFTMTGVVWAMLAMFAVFHNQIRLMWLWLGIALLVDGLDGTMARKAKVKEVVPWFDGSILDNVVDYLTYTFVPAIFIYIYIPVGPKWWAFTLALAIAVSSMFCYCNTGMKSYDYYFVGFPATWNIVAFYFWVLNTGPVFNTIATLVLVVLTLVPTAYLHPFRVKQMMVWNILFITMWLAGVVCFVATSPERYWWEWLLFGLGSAWFVLISAIRSFSGSLSSMQ